MRVAPLPHCTVTGVVAVVSVPCVLGVQAAQPAAAAVGAQRGWVRTSKLIAEIKFALRGLSNLISPVQICGRP